MSNSLPKRPSSAAVFSSTQRSRPRIRDASAAAAKIQTALSGSITLVTDDQQGGTLGPWTASVDQIRGLLALTLGLFKAVPSGFVPAQDKQYLIGFAQLPDGATLDRTEDVIRRMSEIAMGNGRRGGAADHPFSPLTIVLMLVIGIIGFAGSLLLGAYAPDLRSGQNGGTHALSNAATGFSGIVELARTGKVIMARGESGT